MSACSLWCYEVWTPVCVRACECLQPTVLRGVGAGLCACV
jgi:hypothetical protein